MMTSTTTLTGSARRIRPKCLQYIRLQITQKVRGKSWLLPDQPSRKKFFLSLHQHRSALTLLKLRLEVTKPASLAASNHQNILIETNTTSESDKSFHFDQLKHRTVAFVPTSHLDEEAIE